MQPIPMNAGEEGQLNEENKTEAEKDYAEGIKHIQDKEDAMAVNSFHNALLGFEEEGNKHGVAQAADKLGDLCAKREEWDKALDYYDQAYKVCTDDFDRFSLFHLEKKKAQVIRDAGRIEDALAMYIDILDEYSGLNDPQGSVKTLETIAEIYLELDNKEDAADSYRVISSIHERFGHKRHAQQYLAKADELQ